MTEGENKAAIEFLMTYGLAILAAIIAIGVLAYFGVFNPGNFLSYEVYEEGKVQAQHETPIFEDIIFRGNGTTRSLRTLFPLDENLYELYEPRLEFTPEEGGSKHREYILEEICIPEGIKAGYYDEPWNTDADFFYLSLRFDGYERSFEDLTCLFEKEINHGGYYTVDIRRIEIDNGRFTLPKPTNDLIIGEEVITLFDENYDYLIRGRFASKELILLDKKIKVDTTTLDFDTVAENFCDFGRGTITLGDANSCLDIVQGGKLNKLWLAERCDRAEGLSFQCGKYIVEVKR